MKSLHKPEVHHYADQGRYQADLRAYKKEVKRRQEAERPVEQPTRQEIKQSKLDRYLAENGPQTVRFHPASKQGKIYPSELTLPTRASGLKLPVHSTSQDKDLDILAYHLHGIISRDHLNTLVNDFEEHFDFLAKEYKQNEREKLLSQVPSNFSAFSLKARKINKALVDLKTLGGLPLWKREEIYDRFAKADSDFAEEQGFLYRLEVDKKPSESRDSDGYEFVLRIRFPTKESDVFKFIKNEDLMG